MMLMKWYCTRKAVKPISFSGFLLLEGESQMLHPGG